MNDRQKQKATKVKYKREESPTKQSIFVEYNLVKKKHLSCAGARWQWTQHFTKIDQNTRKIEEIYIWNPMTTAFIM